MLETIGFYLVVILVGALVVATLVALGCQGTLAGLLVGTFQGAIYQKYRGVL